MLLFTFIVWTLVVASSQLQVIAQQTYTRYDVPLPYKVTAIYRYRTSKPDNINFQKIQYAPLNLKPLEEVDQDGSTTLSSNNSTDGYTKYNGGEQRHLEPQYSEEINSYRPNVALPYLPGYNLKLQSHRNIDTQAASNDDRYEKNTHLLEHNREEQRENKPMRNQQNYNNVDHRDLTSDTNTVLGLGKSKLNQINSRYVQTLAAMETQNLQPYLIVKTPRLHLNVARAYHFALIPNKALPHLNEFILRNISSQKRNEHKTYLLPKKTKCRS